MTPLDIVLIGFGFLTTLIIVLIVLIVLQKYRHSTFKSRMQKAQNHIDQIYHNDVLVGNPKRSSFLLRQFMTLQDQIILDKVEQKAVIETLELQKMIPKLKRRSNHIIPQIRLVAHYKLQILATPELRDFLLQRLQKERRENIKFVIVYSLLGIMDDVAFSEVMETLRHSSQEYQTRIATILNNHYNTITNYVEPYLESDCPAIQLCMLRLSIKNGNTVFSNYIITNIEEFIDAYLNGGQHDVSLCSIVDTSMQYLLIYHNEFLLSQKLFAKQHDPRIVKYVVDAHAKTTSEKSLQYLLAFYQTKEFNEYYSLALSKMVNEEQRLLLYIIEHYHTIKHPVVHRYVAKVLANKMEYILLKLQDKNAKNVRNIVIDILKDGYTSPIIEFLNTNNISELDQIIVKLIKPIVESNEWIKEDFCLYLDDEVLPLLNLTRSYPIKPKKEPPKIERSKVIWILSVVAFTIFLFPIIYVIRRHSTFGIDSWQVLLTRFVVDANIYLIIYYLVANGIYLFLTILSFYGARKQLRLWNIKTDSLLFEENLLPSISVLAPAYNEELSIIESVSSLLNLSYPNYEIIVINDGSSDKTLQTVVEYFQLKRRNYLVQDELLTRPIRGIYTNKEHPNLIVVDKVNGGKADALNVGINVSSKQYICGIDSDSVLDTDALLRLSAVTLDERYPILAFGGNIVPANGCVINRGKVEERGFADGLIPRFQSLEYLRAFTTGRVGWSQMNSLLIISGAFGLFERQSVIQIGGYITSSGVLKKDSVGEDMELVVRLTHNALKQKQKYYVKYIFHANCYTELPSDSKTLLRQRNRWHRGLIDILSYYRKLFFNPRFKQIGLLAIPYFYFFEVIGPLFEVVGYTLLILGLFLGILNPAIVLGIFVASVWLGIVISLSSLFIAEFDETSFSHKDMVLLILFAIFENFGYRQVLSFHRAYSLFTALKETGKWGDQKRKGITTKP